MELLGRLIGYSVSIASNFYVAAACIVLAHCIFDEGIVWNGKKKGMLFGVVVVDEAISHIFPENGSWVVILGYLFVFAWGCGGKYVRRSFKVFGVVLFTLVCLVMTFGIGSYYIFHGYSMWENHETAYGIVTVCLFAPLYYYLFHGFLQKGIAIYFGKREKRLLAFYFFYLFSFSGLVFLSEESHGFLEEVIYTVMGIVVLAFTIGVPVYIFKGRLGSYYKEMQEYQEAVIQAELSYFRQYKENQELTGRFRHDIQNNLLCLNMMMEKEPKGAKKYLESLLHEVQALSPKIVTGDEMLDCILSAKESLMRQADINFQVEGVLDGGLYLKPMDAVAVFANALDNAIEACMGMSEGEAREIRMAFKKTGQYYLIEIKNTAAVDVDCEKLLHAGYTSKKEHHLHGFGIQNMKRTLEKYGGILQMECVNRNVTVSMILSREPLFGNSRP